MKLFEEFKLWETMWENTATDNTFNEQDSLNKAVPVNVKGIEEKFATPFLSYNELLKDPKFLKYKKLAGIYIYKRIATDGKPAAYYIGQANSGRLVDRFREHKEARQRDSLALHRAIKKYTINNFKLAIIEFCPEADKAELDEKEIFWIDRFGTYVSDDDYNLTPGGGGGVHGKLKPDTEPFEFVVKSLEDNKYTYVQIAKLLKAKYEIKVDESTIRKLNNKLEIRPRELTKKVANKGRSEKQEKPGSRTLYCKEVGSGNIKCLGKFACERKALDGIFKYEEETYKRTYPDDFKEAHGEKSSTYRRKGNITLPDPSKRKKDNTDRTYFVIPPEGNTKYL